MCRAVREQKNWKSALMPEWNSWVMSTGASTEDFEYQPEARKGVSCWAGIMNEVMRARNCVNNCVSLMDKMGARGNINDCRGIMC